MNYAAAAGFAVAVAGFILLRVATAPTPRRPRPLPRVITYADAEAAARAAVAVIHAHVLAAAHRYPQMLTEGLLEPTGPPVPDPGNHPWMLRLATDVHGAVTVPGGTVLLAVQPTTADTGPTLLALPVPPGMTDPVAAAAWTYGPIPVDVYATLTRRT